jgi:HEAT repeat protein
MLPLIACLALLFPALQSPMNPDAPGGGGGPMKHDAPGDKPPGGGTVKAPSDARDVPTAGKPGGGRSAQPGARNAGPRGPAAPTARPPSAAVATGGADLEALTGGELIEDWWIWWEINKSLYLVPADEQARRAPLMPWRVGTDQQTLATSRAQQTRALLPALRAALLDDSASVRASAAVAWGRLGGDEAVDALLPLLRDPAQSVREAALLALGATGSARATALLLGVAHEGRTPDSADDITPSAQPLALVALAVARRHGAGDDLDVLVSALLEDADSTVREAGLLYDSLAGALACRELISRLAADDDLDIRLRCRVTEGLPRYDAALVPAAVAELVTSLPDRRRAAAVTLAGVERGSALPQLDKAFGLEEEPLTRGFMLLSIGAQGGDEARELLALQLRRGRAIDRPWVAIALGLLARNSDDAAARELVRDGLREESSAQSMGAWLLACGLGRDLAAGPALRTALVDASSPRDRMFAALSLSMLRDAESLEALRARLGQENDPVARSGVALGVALFERPDDVPALARELAEANNPLLQSQLASALGLHDTPQAVDALQQLVAGSDDMPAEARAATFEALGLLLDPYPGWRLVHSATGRNFAVFPDWLARALATTTL